MTDAAVMYAVLGAIVVLFVWNRFPVEIVAIGAALFLVAVGILEIDQALAGFGDPAVVFIAALLVLSAGLDASGVTTWAGRELVRLAGASTGRLLLLTMLLSGLLSVLVSVNGAVAALLPVIVIAAQRLRLPPSRLLIPLNFAAFGGSMLALTGSPVNVLVADAADATDQGFGFIEFALVGVPLLAGTVAIVSALGDRLLPDRQPERLPLDLSDHAQTLAEEYLLPDGIVWLRVRPESPLVGADPHTISLDAYEGLTLVSVRPERAPQRTLVPGDVLIVHGPSESVGSLALDNDLGIRSADHEGPKVLVSEQLGLAEVVIPPRSNLIGTNMFPGMINESGTIVILAIRRGDLDWSPDEGGVQAGDTLLLQGTWDALDENLGMPELLVVDSPEAVRRQALPLGSAGKKAIAVSLAMVVILVSGIAHPVVAGLLAAGALILLGVISLPEAYRRINWTAVVLVAAMFPLSTAMYKTGAAEDVARLMVDVVGDNSPYFFLAGVFVVTAGFSQLISSTATALIMIPISLSGAAELDISPQPVLMCLAIAAVSSFLTPISTPVNLMIMGPGGYRFDDYWKLGLPLLLFYMAVAILVVPIFWSF